MANSLRGVQRRCGVLWPASVNVRHRLRRVQLGKQFEGIGCRYILQFPISRGNAPCSVPPRRAPQKLDKGLGSRVQVDGTRLPVALPGASAPPRINGGVQELAETFDAQGTAELDMYGDYGVKAAQKNRAVYEVLRIDPNGKVRTIYVKRRDLLRTYGLQPRDLRRIDPAWDNTQSSQTMVVKDQVLLINMGGVRLVVASEKALLFEAEKVPSVKFLDIVLPHLQSRASSQFLRLKTMESREQPLNATSNLVGPTQPFEQEILEGALIMATGILDAELVALMKRVRVMLGKLPQEINPVNLEELRRIKQSCVELEAKAATLAEVLEEILDDEEKIADINLSSRPLREARQRRRERNRLRREQNVGMGVAGDRSYQSAQDALEEMEDEEQEERDIEETEDMLEYYLQRTSTTQSEAERVLAGARDLEESIGVSLSARRFEVNRLELMLSMGSFAAALGAMIAGIFGMNLRNTMEMSALSFYGITAAIVLGCVYVFFAIFLHTKRRRIV